MDTAVKATLMEMEQLAEDILTDKQQLVDFDRRRQNNREALRNIQDYKHDEVWLFVGQFFMKKKTTDVRNILQKDQQIMQEETDKINSTMKAKSTQLHELEGRANQMKGFNLKPLSGEDLDWINTNK